MNTLISNSCAAYKIHYIMFIAWCLPLKTSNKELLEQETKQSHYILKTSTSSLIFEIPSREIGHCQACGMRIGLPGIPLPAPITHPRRCWNSPASSWHQRPTIILNILPFYPPAITKGICFSALYFQIRDNLPKLFLHSSLSEQERRWGSWEERISIKALTEPANTSLDVVFCIF